MPATFSDSELFILHAAVERLGGLMTAGIGHFERAGMRDLSDLLQTGVEDVSRLREMLGSKGVAKRPLIAPKPPTPFVLPPDHFEKLSVAIDNAASEPAA